MAIPVPSNSYRTLAVETAGPGRLILMLFDGALRFLHAAETGFEEEDLRERNEAINNNLIRVQNIVIELQRSLDLEQGGDFARNMYALYDFMMTQIMDANMKKQIEPIRTVGRLLGEIREAWQELRLLAFCATQQQRRSTDDCRSEQRGSGELASGFFHDHAQTGKAEVQSTVLLGQDNAGPAQPGHVRPQRLRVP